MLLAIIRQIIKKYTNWMKELLNTLSALDQFLKLFIVQYMNDIQSFLCDRMVSLRNGTNTNGNEE